MEKMKSTLREISATERALEIEVPRENFNHIFNDKVKKYSRELRLDGYRKGAVPKRIITERFREPLTNETLEKLTEETVRKTCEEHKLKPVAPGQVTELKNEEGQPIHMNVLVEVDQEVDFTDYKDLGIDLEPVAEVSAQHIDAEIDYYRQNMAKEELSSNPATKGDAVSGIYLEIEVDGKSQPVDGDSKFKVIVGSDKIPEFNEAFKGTAPGDEKEINLTYPQDYQTPELAGRAARYRVKIDGVFKVNLPAADEDFAKSMGQKDLDQLKKTIRENLKKSREKEVKSKAHHLAVQKILERHPFEVPKAKIENLLEYQAHKHDHGQDHNHEAPHHHDHNFTPEMKREAEYQLKKHRILEEISKKEGLKASQAEVDAKVQALAHQYGVEFEMLKSSLRKNGKINDIRYEIKTEKTLDFLAGISENPSK